MLKRLRWMAMGLGVGLWAQRRFKALVKSYTPPEVASRAAKRSTEAAGRTAGEVRTAFAEGRQAMRQRESELRQKVDDRVDHHPADGLPVEAGPVDGRQAPDPKYPPPLHYRPGAGR